MVYKPTYKRFKFSLHKTFENKKFYGREKESISISEKIIHNLSSVLGFFVDKVAEEHFDFVIAGSDCMLALIQAKIIQEKGMRVLIYPFNIEDEKINNLVTAYTEIESEKLSKYISKKIFKKNLKLSNNEALNEIAKLIEKRSSEKGYGKVMMVNGQSYSIDKDWTSFHEKKPMLMLMGNEKKTISKNWEMAIKNITRIIQNNHIIEAGYLGVNDTCITTFDNIIFNTRPDFSMNIDNSVHSVVYFADAKKNIESRTQCSSIDRIKDISEVASYFNKEFIEAKNAK